MLLEHQAVGVFLVTNWTLGELTQRRLRPVHPHVCLEITFSGETSVANLALEGPLSSVYAVVHLQS